MKFLVLLMFISSAFAQHSEQPVKEDSTDLRDQSVLFSIEDVSAGKSWFLERSPSFTNVLRKIEKGDESVRKIDGRVAQKLDRDFAARFIKCQYEITSPEGECKVTLRLTMKGEAQDICAKDDKKSQEIQTFLTELAQRF